MDVALKIRDRKHLLRKARSWKRRDRTARSFKAFIREVWPTGVSRIGDLELEHAITVEVAGSIPATFTATLSPSSAGQVLPGIVVRRWQRS